jgi:myo-inositol 2-dehydrogenase/D-chiro-inositol 1-dehydrogenase
MFTGTAGRIFVNRGTLTGKPVEALATNPLDRGDWNDYAHDNLDRPLRTGKLDAIVNHMGNFFDCITTRHDPISDVESQHRSVTTCHLGNIAQQLGRTIQWDPQTETFPEDKEATALMSREQRSGFEVK